MQPVKLFLCGDVMTGRGIDQILRHPCAAPIYEPYVKDARDYVRLAERASGPVARRVDDPYIWGDALEELERARPDARIINLETAVTQSDDWLEKGINYRMHPQNVGCLTAARIDCCTLANNHILDWSEQGLIETLETLHAARLRTAGAGRNADEAQAPAHLPRMLVYSLGCEDSGIPPSWAASAERPGVDFLADLSTRSAERLAKRIDSTRQPGDLVVVSIHWGGNWGYRVPRAHTEFAHRLIDAGGADVIHGHSSHHPKAIELYRGRLILYGCGDFINDYEGISGHDEFRGDLGLMYLPRLDSASGELIDLELVALCRRRLRLERASEIDSAWLCGVLNKEGERFGVAFEMRPGSRFALARATASAGKVA
jgi:poly-gamma-glutamate capsule biosynthesis protein CapA/YwtB (metallophosphatase superfamily)